MNFLKDFFDRRSIIDKLVDQLGKETVTMTNGLSEFAMTPVQISHAKCRHLKITIGRYIYAYKGSSEKSCPLVEIWIDKDRKIVSVGSDFGRSNIDGLYEVTKIDKHCSKLCGKLKEGDPFETNIDAINHLIKWFYEGPVVWFPFNVYNAIGHYGFEIRENQRTREVYAKDKVRQKHLVHVMNCICSK